MRYRVTDYAINGQTIVLPDEVTIEDIRLVVNETLKIVICSSMQKDNVIVSGNTVTILKSICELQQDDKLTIEIDQGDNIYDIIDQIDGGIDITNLAKEETLNLVKDKLDNLDVNVDLREISKQGTNPDATNTKILEETRKMSDIDQLLAIQLQTIIGE